MPDQQPQQQTTSSYQQTTSNGFAEKVEGVLIDKIKLVWGIVIALGVIGGGYLSIQLQTTHNTDLLIAIQQQLAQHEAEQMTIVNDHKNFADQIATLTANQNIVMSTLKLK